MKINKIILPAVITLLLAFSYITHVNAQTGPAPTSSQATLLSPTPTIVKSDFALDLEQGEKDIANDQEAQQNQKDLKDNESVGVNEQGEDSNEPEEIEEEDLEQSSNDLNENLDQEEINEDKDSSTEKNKIEEEKSDEHQGQTETPKPTSNE